MNYVTLGRMGVELSCISLGTWSYGGPNMAGKNQPVGWAGQTDQDSKDALRKAYREGINHWDTADVYGDGHSERVIGSMWNEIPREDIFIATKVGWDMGSYNHWYYPVLMRANMERSLKNLNTDCVDLMYLHHCNFGKEEQYFDDALEVITRFQDEGKTRFIGLSDWFLDKIMKFIDRVDPDVIQPYRNVMDDNYISSGLKAHVEANNLGVCFFSPIKHGLLTGKYTAPATFETGDFRTTVKDFADQKMIDKMQSNKKKLESRFLDHPQPVMHGLVDALLSDAPTGCVLLGQRNVNQVAAAAKLGKTLSNEDAEWVQRLYR